MKSLTLVVAFIVFVGNADAFIPFELLENVFLQVNQTTSGFYSETTTHDDIIEYGIYESVVEYFRNQTNGSRVSLTKASNEYRDVRNIYFDYYGVYICDLSVRTLVKTIFRPFVAVVDLDPKTKDNPYSHFDAEKFVESNQRVINFTNEINTKLDAKSYERARELTGEILHTIQDFYSHSNWVEMGKTSINTDIGKASFNNLAVIAANESNPCIENCSYETVTCGSYLSLLDKLLNNIGFSNLITCPMNYYKCSGNIAILNKLVSGYYSGQKLEDGTAVNKPVGLKKCSHGGILDKTSNESAVGGINKDSGFYVLSPHANLHQTAVSLAIKHTKQYFEDIRSRIGDAEYANFLKLIPTSTQLAAGAKNVTTCDASKLAFNSFTLLILLQTLVTISFTF